MSPIRKIIIFADRNLVVSYYDIQMSLGRRCRATRHPRSASAQHGQNGMKSPAYWQIMDTVRSANRDHLLFFLLLSFQRMSHPGAKQCPREARGKRRLIEELRCDLAQRVEGLGSMGILSRFSRNVFRTTWRTPSQVGRRTNFARLAE